MPAFPPRTAIVASLTRGQDARDAHAAGTVVIGGVEYPCELHLDAVAPQTEIESGAMMMVQRGRAVIRKARLVEAPARGTVIRVNGVDYSIEDVGGQDAHEPSWVIPFNRLPPR